MEINNLPESIGGAVYRNQRNPCTSPAVVTAGKEKLWVVHRGDIIGFFEQVQLNLIILSWVSRLVNLKGMSNLIVLSNHEIATHALVSVYCNTNDIAIEESGCASVVS